MVWHFISVSRLCIKNLFTQRGQCSVILFPGSQTPWFRLCFVSALTLPSSKRHSASVFKVSKCNHNVGATAERVIDHRYINPEHVTKHMSRTEQKVRPNSQWFSDWSHLAYIIANVAYHEPGGHILILNTRMFHKCVKCQNTHSTFVGQEVVPCPAMLAI